MAINPDPSHRNYHEMVCATSGGGKTQLIGNSLLPKGAVSAHRVIMWDIDEDYKAARFYDRVSFVRAVRDALASGRGFRLAFSGRPTVENFRWWCSVVWSVLDGKKVTHIVIEELADVSPSVGKALPEFGELLRKGRKYGARIIMATQRGAEIPKTAWTQVARRYIGQQEMGDRVRMSKEAGIHPDALAALNPMMFYKKEAGASEPELIKIKYKKLN